MVGRLAWFGVGALIVSACGHSEDQWQRQVRANEDLRGRLAADQAKNAALRADRAEAVDHLERLQRDLRQAGIDPDRVRLAVAEQARATEEYSRRKQQAAAMRHRMEILVARLGALPAGVLVGIRNNRASIRLTDEALFDASGRSLSVTGRAVLQRIAQVIRSEPALSERTYQIGVHAPRNAGRGGGAPVGTLGLAHAEEVLSFLVRPSERAGGGLAPARWSAADYSDGDVLVAAQPPAARSSRASGVCEIVLEPAPEEQLDLTVGAP